MKKKFKITTLLLFIILFGFQAGKTQPIFGWRPENRTGVSNETGLLKSWPEGGPALLWANLEIPRGNSSVSFSNDKIFITGSKDNDDILVALDMKGNILWQKSMGRAWNGSHPESRATPTVQGDRVYTCSGYGDLACFNGNTGDIVWSYKAWEENKGTCGSWGIAESLLIDGDKLYFSPGGPETMTIALNKNTGKIIWRSKSLGDKASYVSPILANYAGKKMIINASLGHIFGVDTSNGDILWKVKVNNPREGRDLIICVTPLFKDGMVYVTIGYNVGGMMIKIADDGNNANIVWTDDLLDVHHGGVVQIDGYIYGANWANNANGDWCCIDWNTGEKKWVEHWNCKGSIIAAEGKLYIYEEKRGNVGLLNVTPEKFDLVSSFQIDKGDAGPFWAHPVIHNGVLYLRHTNALMAYDIKAN